MHRLKIAAYLFVALWISIAHAGSYDEFFQAVIRDDAGAVRGLLQRGMDPNSRDPSGQTALFLALRDGNFRVAEALLASPRIEIDAENAVGETALMIAALKGQTEWCSKLVERGAKIDKAGWSPLHYAATGPEPAVVKLLLDRGATVDATSPNRSTPLMMAAMYGSESSVDLLLARGANPKARNDLGLDAADFARRAKREPLAARLSALVK
jgi:ankyrin repeat protein